MDARFCFALVLFTVYFKDVYLVMEPDTICNYTGLCTDDAIRAGVSIQQPQVSCCQPCVCSNDCVSGNCCPESRLSLRMRTVCRDQDAMFNGYRGLKPVFIPIGSYDNYYVVDTCPTGSGSDIRQACNSPEELEDYVMVSSIDHSVVFKNSKCAKCNNVFDYIIWKMIIFNDMFLDYQDYNNNIILRNWNQSSYYIFSQPPLIHAKQLSASECFFDTDLDFTCADSGAALQDQCDTRSFPLYTHRGVKYPNVYCILCRSSKADICEDFDAYKSWTLFPFTLLVDIHTLQSSVQPSDAALKERCGGGFVTNPVTGECTWLFCPLGQSVVDGQCMQNAFKTNGLALSINFRVTVHGMTLPSNENVQLATKIFRVIMNHFEGCMECRYIFYISKDDSDVFYIQIFLLTTRHCEEGYALQQLHSYNYPFQAKTFNVLTDSGIQDVSVSLNLVSRANESLKPHKFVSIRCQILFVITPKYMCPYIEETIDNIQAYEAKNISLEAIADKEVQGETTVYRVCVADLLPAIDDKYGQVPPTIPIVDTISTASHACLVVSAAFTIIFNYAERNSIRSIRTSTYTLSALTLISPTFDLVFLNCKACSSTILNILEGISLFCNFTVLLLLTLLIFVTSKTTCPEKAWTKTYFVGLILIVLLALGCSGINVYIEAFHVETTQLGFTTVLAPKLVIQLATILAVSLPSVVINCVSFWRLPSMSLNQPAVQAECIRYSRSCFSLFLLFVGVLVLQQAQRLWPLVSLTIVLDVSIVVYAIAFLSALANITCKTRIVECFVIFNRQS